MKILLLEFLNIITLIFDLRYFFFIMILILKSKIIKEMTKNCEFHYEEECISIRHV